MNKEDEFLLTRLAYSSDGLAVWEALWDITVVVCTFLLFILKIPFKIYRHFKPRHHGRHTA